MPSAVLPGRQLLSVVDDLFDRVYGSARNPLYQSGTIVVALLLAVLLTGVWLLLFYRIGTPWASVRAISDAPWTAAWVRAFHRYASDAAVVATLVHALRLFLQRRTWGPRTLAWISGLALFGLVVFSGITGFVLVWDHFGRALAVEGARILDALPILSEPIGRAFVGERPVPGTFFFLILFLHISVPLGLGLLFWLHVSRLSRPATLPPRPVMVAVFVLLFAASILAPPGLDPEGSPFQRPATMIFDWFFGGWLPLTIRLGPGAVWGAAGGVAFLLLAIPRWTQLPAERRPPSVVDEGICVGCWQCSWDCPFDAITMIPRSDGRAEVVARVDPDRCVSCGICAGSCAPMGVGPPGRTGRDQLERLRAFLAEPARRPGEVVAIVCDSGAGGRASTLAAEGAVVYPVDCAGNLHTSVVELLVRGGAGGVLMLPCPARDCHHREGPKWLDARIYHGREAELQARVDRRRIAVQAVGAGDAGGARRAVAEFREQLALLDRPAPEPVGEVETECVTPAIPAGRKR